MKRTPFLTMGNYENGAWTDNVVFVANPEDVGLEAHAPRKPKRPRRSKT